MAILTPSQLTSASNATYFDNATGSITPDAVRGLNTNWISSSILVSQTGSMSVATASFVVSASYAGTASILLGSVVSASYAATGSKVSILDDNGNNNHKVLFVNTAVATSGEQLLIDPTTTQFTYNPSTNLLVVTASLALNAVTASLATTNLYTASVSNNVITFTEGDGSTFNLTVATGSGTNTISASFATTANSVNILSQSLTITGSFNGLVVSQSIASNTSSLNFGIANFFTSAVSASTFFDITNPKAGETVNVLLTTVGVATASFSSNVKQVSGSAYTPTSGSGKNDVITFISFDGTSVFLANVKNLI